MLVSGRVTCYSTLGKMRVIRWGNCFPISTVGFFGGNCHVVEATVSTEAHQAPSVPMRHLAKFGGFVGCFGHELRYPNMKVVFVAIYI